MAEPTRSQRQNSALAGSVTDEQLGLIEFPILGLIIGVTEHGDVAVCPTKPIGSPEEFIEWRNRAEDYVEESLQGVSQPFGLRLYIAQIPAKLDEITSDDPAGMIRFVTESINSENRR